MAASRWQKQNIYFQPIVWASSAIISFLLILILSSLGWGIEVASASFLVAFVVLRVALAFVLKNRFTNSMVRVLKFDYEELERDFRTLFKLKFIRFYRKIEEEAYSYEFPGRDLRMTVRPYWLNSDMSQPPATKVTLRIVNAQNKEFAEMLADSIDEMAVQRAARAVKA
ncbi:MAG: hypothetical protein R3D55_12685 [Chloroflexota bacterium]